MGKRWSRRCQEPHWASWTTSNSCTCAQGHQSTFCIVVGRNHLEDIVDGGKWSCIELNLVGSGRQGVLTAWSGRAWTLGASRGRRPAFLGRSAIKLNEALRLYVLLVGGVPGLSTVL